MSKFTVGLICFSLLCLPACTALKKRPPEKADPFQAAAAKPLPPEKAKKVLKEAGNNWLYGPGLGKTAVNVGATVAFPPYGLYLLGKAALDMSGYESPELTDVLPEEDKKEVDKYYNRITSIPGKLAAEAAGEDFRDEKTASERIKKVLSE
ncbi:MAG: hypothetical protein D6719_07810 [Candidatus Dadabacteria bacterium]|nr:MAG: hypothetical protein D6719_07810 [Candidatus Dadabacteria bacterium]